MARFCEKCGGERHARNCPEMSFPSGQRRDDPTGVGLPPKLDPSRKFPPHAESPLSEEMAKIFAGSTEKMIERHIASVKNR